MANCENVVVYPFLDDDKYFTIFSLCNYSFLPLTFATANNTLLEAQILGVQSILPKINGVSDYADMQHNLFYENMNELCNLFLKLQINQYHKEIEEFSHKFFWENIYSKLNDLYRNVCELG